MTEKFKDIPVEEDTQIITSVKANIAEYDVVYQKWKWDGILAESVIFFNDDVIGLTEEQIKREVALCKDMVKENSQMTFNKGDTYTFVNFNFVYN